MQTAQGIGWNQIVGMFLGAGFVLATFVVRAWNGRRRRALVGERPPQRAKLLRPAGYSLQCSINDLSERWNFELAQALSAGVGLGLLSAGVFPVLEGLILNRFTITEIFSQPQAYVFYSVAALAIAAVAWLIKSVVESFSIQKKIRNCQFGLRGEQAVAEALADRALAAAGYTVFHDILGDGSWNIDHVVVGPGGIFVLETKTRPRRKSTRPQPDHEVNFDGQTLCFPWCDDRNAAKQVIRNAQWVQRFVEGFGPKAIEVQPVIVVPGWFVKVDGRHDVKVMNAKYLASNFLPSVPRLFSQDELKPMLRRFDERCRDLEF
jgi:hypothetical protein